MFLNRLIGEEKIAFLELAHYVARSDNNFSESEKEIISKYCTEMQIDNIILDENIDMTAIHNGTIILPNGSGWMFSFLYILKM